MTAAERRFSGGRLGSRESGVYSFWTVMSGGQRLFTVRTIEGRSVENRLREYSSMEVEHVGMLHTIVDRVLPATIEEINLWLDSHPDDAVFTASQQDFN